MAIWIENPNCSFTGQIAISRDTAALVTEKITPIVSVVWFLRDESKNEWGWDRGR